MPKLHTCDDLSQTLALVLAECFKNLLSFIMIMLDLQRLYVQLIFDHRVARVKHSPAQPLALRGTLYASPLRGEAMRRVSVLGSCWLAVGTSCTCGDTRWAVWNVGLPC